MTVESNLDVAPITVPEKGEVDAAYTLEPTGDGAQWILRDEDGEQVNTVTLQFQGVKQGGTGKSGKANLSVTLINTDLVFADKNDTADKKYDGMETYDVIDDGLGAVQKIKKDSHNAQLLNIVIKANKQNSNGFSYLWVALDPSGAPVKSADPKVVVEPA